MAFQKAMANRRKGKADSMDGKISDDFRREVFKPREKFK